jgi:hypothetical protein
LFADDTLLFFKATMVRIGYSPSLSRWQKWHVWLSLWPCGEFGMFGMRSHMIRHRPQQKHLAVSSMGTSPLYFVSISTLMATWRRENGGAW